MGCATSPPAHAKRAKTRQDALPPWAEPRPRDRTASRKKA